MGTFLVLTYFLGAMSRPQTSAFTKPHLFPEPKTAEPFMRVLVLTSEAHEIRPSMPGPAMST